MHYRFMRCCKFVQKIQIESVSEVSCSLKYETQIELISIHPCIFLTHVSLFGSQVVGAYLGHCCSKAGYTLDRSPVCCRPWSSMVVHIKYFCKGKITFFYIQVWQILHRFFFVLAFLTLTSVSSCLSVFFCLPLVMIVFQVFFFFCSHLRRWSDLGLRN